MTSQPVNISSASDEQLVVFPPDRGLGILAVSPPFPIGFKPQQDGALGININLVHGDRDGLLVYILAYLNMSDGDNIRVFIENRNVPVAEFSVTDAHFEVDGTAKNIPFYISADIMEARFDFLKPQNKDFWVDINRVSGNPSDPSLPVSLFYKYPAPGEADTDGGKPFNQGLKLPVASETVVDQTVIDEGMFVTVLEYFNQCVGDVVVLAFGSLLLETTVSELGDVLFELSPEQLATLKPTNSLVVRWEVFDVVENASGWSDSLILTFKPGVVLLAAPIFEQADADDVVDHNNLAGGPLNILVTGIFAVNDVIDLTLQGLTKGGDSVSHTYSQRLSAASRLMTFPVENERVRNLIDGSARASYLLTKAGKTQPSKPADATFTGTSQPLSQPIVEPLVDGKLPADTAMATVTVAHYWPLKNGAKVELRWQTTDLDGVATLFIFALIVTDPTQAVFFKVPARYIAPFADTPLTVQNTITNPGEVEVFSELAQLKFGEGKKPLSVDTSLMRLDGVMVRSGYCPNLNGVDALGNTMVRTAIGGYLPYVYRSSNSAVAAVDTNGKVSGMGNGTATITITDQRNAQVSYAVSVSNVYSLLVHGGIGWTFPRYIESLAQRGEVGLTAQIRAVMARCYFQPWFAWSAGPTYSHLANAWTSTVSGSSAEVYNSDTRSFGWLAQSADPHNGLSFSLRNAGALGGLSKNEEDVDAREII